MTSRRLSQLRIRLLLEDKPLLFRRLLAAETANAGPYLQHKIEGEI